MGLVHEIDHVCGLVRVDIIYLRCHSLVGHEFLIGLDSAMECGDRIVVCDHFYLAVAVVDQMIDGYIHSLFVVERH